MMGSGSGGTEESSTGQKRPRDDEVVDRTRLPSSVPLRQERLTPPRQDLPALIQDGGNEDAEMAKAPPSLPVGAVSAAAHSTPCDAAYPSPHRCQAIALSLGQGQPGDSASNPMALDAPPQASSAFAESAAAPGSAEDAEAQLQKVPRGVPCPPERERER